MSKHTDTSFLIVSSWPAFYQHLLRGAVSHQQLGERILQRIKIAHGFRQVDRVRELARLLASIPIKEFHLIAQYYLVWCKCRELEYHSDVLERLAEQTRTYKAKALISRAAFDVYQAKSESAFYFYSEALKAGPSVSDFIKATTGIATVKSTEGFNKLALRDLESLLPLLKQAEPIACFEVMNAYAVELLANNRLSEAQNVLARTSRSPFRAFYPEVQDTLLEVTSQLKRRSTIAISAMRIEPHESVGLINNPVQPPLERAALEPRIQIAINFINANLDRTISLMELASVVNLSSSHLSYLFNAETGFSPGKYLAKLRMEKAAQLLETSLLSVKQIMAAVGYNSKANFSRRFKKRFGVTPSAYRKRAFASHLPLKF